MDTSHTLDRIQRTLEELPGMAALARSEDSLFLNDGKILVVLKVATTGDDGTSDELESLDLPNSWLVIASKACKGLEPTLEVFEFVSRELISELWSPVTLTEDHTNWSLQLGCRVRVPADTIDPNEITYSFVSLVADSLKLGELVTSRFGASWWMEAQN